MEAVEAFAARRSERLTTADAEIRVFVERALISGEWEEAVEAASVLWLETFEEAAPGASSDATLREFQSDLLAALRKTRDPGGEATVGQIDRVARYIGTATVNDATFQGHRAGGGLRKRWVSMRDSDVRDTHAVANGQIRSVVAEFDVGGAKLRYPGDPRGPVQEIINCRCLLMGVGRVRRGSQMSRTQELARMRLKLAIDPEEREALERYLTAAAASEEIGELIVEETDEEEIEEGESIDDFPEEIPVHGVAAIEGVPTGDGRMFAINGLTNRPLPLPIRYEVVGNHGGNTSEVVTVGRIDELWRDESNQMRYRGVLMMYRDYTEEVIQGIVDGTIRGVSVEVDDIAVSMEESKEADFETGEHALTVFSRAQIDGFTIVPIPAFHQAFVALGHDFVDELPEEDQKLIAAGCVECEEVDEGDEDEEISEPDKTAIIYGVIDPEDAAFAVSSEPIPHLTMVLMDGMGGTLNADAAASILEEVRAAAASMEGPIELPVKNRGELGDDKADVLFVNPEAILALRESLIAEGTTVRAAYDVVEQFPDWTAHVTLGYPEVPAQGEYSGETIRIIGLGIMENGEGPTFPFGEESLTAAAGESFAPGTKDGPGWITHPRATSRIRRYWVRGPGAAKIRWGAPGDFNRCRRQLAKYVQRPDWLAGLCANMHKEATGTWPGIKRGDKGFSGGEAAPLFTLVASAGDNAVPRRYFEEPDLVQPEGIIIDGDHVYGYVATWGVCHIGIPDVCTTAPHSATNYGYFLTGFVDTDEGPVQVGQITMGTGHASDRAGLRAAAEHYDNTGSAVADVAIGENSTGIWFSGVLRDTATAQQRRDLEATGRLSGDWRRMGHSLELVAALAVNVPGFPIPRTSLAASAFGQESLVAAGIVDPAPTGAQALSADEVASVARAAVEEYVHIQKRGQRAAALRSTINNRTLASLRDRVNERG